MLAMAVGSKERPAEDSSRGDIKCTNARLDFATEAGQKVFGCQRIERYVGGSSLGNVFM